MSFFISSFSRFKNVMFDIKSGDEVGVFEVSAKFMGVAMEKVELVFQVRQYSFGQAKLTVKLITESSTPIVVSVAIGLFYSSFLVIIRPYVNLDRTYFSFNMRVWQ